MLGKLGAGGENQKVPNFAQIFNFLLVLDRLALLVHNGGGSDVGDVLWTSDGALPELVQQSKSRHHKRNGGSKLLIQERLRSDVCPRKHNVL